MASPSHTPIALSNAFERLKQSVSPKDAVVFQSTTLKDVWDAAREIERLQRERQSTRNLRRIEPLLHALEKYSKPIDVVCNGTPYLPWIWAPIKLMLQLANEHANVFDKLLGAYAQIAEALPRFDRFEKAFGSNTDFQNLLAVVYAEILDFHRRAYKFFRRRAWHIVFDSLWKSFAPQFNGILESLARHRDLVDKEALSSEIVEARTWRAQVLENLEQRDKDIQNAQLRDSLTWLVEEDQFQEDDLDRLQRRRQLKTCDWVLSIDKLSLWVEDNSDEPILWLKGIPGAGKSILCSRIIEFLKNRQNVTVAYYFCNSHTNERDRCSQILKSIAAQLLRAHLDLAAHVADKYAHQGRASSIQQLRKLIPELLATIPLTRIVVDGLDECHERDQKSILTELLSLSKDSGAHCKVLFSSRESVYISRTLRRKPNISLKERKADVDTDIRVFVNENLTELRDRFGNQIMDDVEQRLVQKADGMFLWVRLIITTLEDRYSVQELLEAVDSLPEGLNEAYGRILDRILKDHSPHARHKAIRILEWMACSYRVLRSYEIQDGIVFQPGNTGLDDATKLNKAMLDLCKPIIEEGPGNTVNFVHFSAKEYNHLPTNALERIILNCETRYILDYKSGPFLQNDVAHYNITFSCVAYLSTVFCFIDQTNAFDDSKIRVVKGFHGLHHYATEFWITHLLDFVRLRGNFDKADSAPLVEQLYRLLRFRKKSLTPTFTSELHDINRLSPTESLLLPFDAVPEIQSLVRDVLAFREILSRKKQAQQSREDLILFQAENDPTLFSEVNQHYQTVVEHFLDVRATSAPDGVDQDVIDAFQETFGASAFVCRYHQCSRVSEGFASKKQRDRHESLHTKQFRCADAVCEFYTSGFTTKTALQRHNRTYHSKNLNNEIPAFHEANSRMLQQQEHAGNENSSATPENSNHFEGEGLQPYQLQLMLQEQQNKKRFLMARLEQDLLQEELREIPPLSAAEDMSYQAQLKFLEHQNKQRLMMARQEQDLHQEELRKSPPLSVQPPNFSASNIPSVEDIQALLKPREQHNKNPLRTAPRNPPPLSFQPPNFPNSTPSPIIDDPIKCICGFKHYYRSTVCCERCATWQHIECYYQHGEMPEIHNCVDCEPRLLDAIRGKIRKIRGNERQSERRKRLNLST